MVLLVSICMTLSGERETSLFVFVLNFRRGVTMCILWSCLRQELKDLLHGFRYDDNNEL